MFDVSGLTEIKMQKRNGWQGSYYVDGNGVCRAKTCSHCRDILDASNFWRESGTKYRLSALCRDYYAEKPIKRKNRSVSDVLRDRDRVRPDGTKKCYKCKKTLPLDSFHTSLAKIDGLQDSCTVCNGKVSLSPEHRKKYNKWRSLWRKALSMRSDEEIAIDRSATNPSGAKECRKCNVVKPFSDFYGKRSEVDGLRDRCKPCDHKTTSDFRKKPYLDYWNDNGIPLECYVCGDPWDDADHVIAESREGSDEPYNRLPICKPCNSSKYMHPLEDWIREKYPDIADEVLHRVTVEYGFAV